MPVNQSDAQNSAGDQLVTEAGNTYKNVVGNTTALVKTGSGIFSGLMINNNSGNGVIAIYDGTSAAGTLIATVTTGSPSGGLLSTSGIPVPNYLGPLGVIFTTGLYVVTTGSTTNNFTVLYQ